MTLDGAHRFLLVRSTHKTVPMCCHLACSVFNSRMKNPLSPAAVQTARVVLRCKKKKKKWTARQVKTWSHAFNPVHYRRSNYKEFPVPCVCTGNEMSVYICSALWMENSSDRSELLLHFPQLYFLVLNPIKFIHRFSLSLSKWKMVETSGN